MRISAEEAFGLLTTPVTPEPGCYLTTWYCQGWSGSRLVTTTICRQSHCEALADLLALSRQRWSRVCLVRKHGEREVTERVVHRVRVGG